LQEAAPSCSHEQGSRSQSLKPAVDRDSPGTAFVHQQDRRAWCVSRDQNRLGLSGGDVRGFLELESRSLCDTARHNPATGRDL
jgi:hypothetical protein